MLSRIAVGRFCCAQSTDLGAYRPLVGDTLVDEIDQLAGRLRGVRACHLNATAAGGGVAELLERLVPIYRSLGIEAEWLVIHGDKEFFAITKGFHNGLQGAEFPITSSIAQEYLDHNRASAESLDAKKVSARGIWPGRIGSPMEEKTGGCRRRWRNSYAVSRGSPGLPRCVRGRMC